jgi:outer membrane receptor protein involved in Fe transport
MKVLLKIQGLAALLSFCAAAGAAAQGTSGAIAGRVRDAQGLVVPGVTVTVTGSQGSRTAVTDDRGAFTVPFLTPGTYRLRVELSGFSPLTREDLIVRLGETTEVALTLELEGVAEAVTVRGGTPVIDARSTTTGVNLDSETLNRIPVGRRFSDTLYVSAGVSSSGGAGVANPSVSGGTGLENLYVVDGVNITNQGFGALGSYSIVFGSLGNGTPYDFVKEVQVKTGGYEAEFGQSTGGVINVVTKSGSNLLRGSAFGYTRLEALEADYTQLQTPNGTVNTRGTELGDYGLELGGPAIANRLFWFGAIDPQFDRRTFVAPDGFPLAGLGEVDRERRIVSYAGKGTWQAAPGHRIDVSVFGDPATGENGPQRASSLLASTTSAFSELSRFGGHNQVVRYDGVLSRHWLIQASVGRAVNEIRETPSVDEWAVTDNTVTPFVRTGGIGFFEAGNRSANLQYELKATNLFNGWGRHELRYGVTYEDVEYDQVNQRTGPTFTLPDGRQTATGASLRILPDPNFGRIYRVVGANLNTARSTDQRYTSLFVQDTWAIGDRLTVRPGLRYEQQTLTGSLAELTLDNNWAPRIGATWSYGARSQGKVYGHYGIYFARMPNDLAARVLSADESVVADYFDADLTQPIPEGVLAGPEGQQTPTHFSIAGVGAALIDPDAKATYYNEYVAGTEYEVLRGLNVGVRFVHRDLGRLLEDVAPYPLAAADLGVPGATSADYVLTNPGPSTAVIGDSGATFEEPVHTYNAVEITGDKRFGDNWSLHASYRWSRLRGTVEGFFRDDNGQSDPGITSLYDFPTNDPSYTAIGGPQFGYRGDIRYLGALGDGPLPLDRPHEVKVFGSYSFPMALNLGIGASFSSGKPLTPLASNPHPNYRNGGEIPEGPRGSGFETVDGFRTRTPFLSDVSLHADWTVPTGAGTRLSLIADVFNVFDAQTVLDYDNFTESSFGVPNPNFGLAARGTAAQFQTPRQVRFGIRYTF